MISLYRNVTITKISIIYTKLLLNKMLLGQAKDLLNNKYPFKFSGRCFHVQVIINISNST